MKGLSIKLLSAATILSAVVFSASMASASTTVPATDLPVDTNLTIIDTGGGTANTTDTSGTTEDINALVTEQGDTVVEENVTTNEGTELPIDEGVQNPVSQEVDISKPEEPTAEAPAQETTVLTEKAPVVEPLPKTGLVDTSIYIALGLLLIASVTLFLNRRTKEV